MGVTRVKLRSFSLGCKFLYQLSYLELLFYQMLMLGAPRWDRSEGWENRKGAEGNRTFQKQRVAEAQGLEGCMQGAHRNWKAARDGGGGDWSTEKGVWCLWRLEVCPPGPGGQNIIT